MSKLSNNIIGLSLCFSQAACMTAPAASDEMAGPVPKCNFTTRNTAAAALGGLVEAVVGDKAVKGAGKTLGTITQATTTDQLNCVNPASLDRGIAPAAQASAPPPPGNTR